jgi:predicted acylesterase/phospholipase RssA
MYRTKQNPADEQILQKLKEYDFKFENLAFEGGGVKGVGHIGMIQVRDRIII